LSEITIFDQRRSNKRLSDLTQNRETKDWKAVAIFPRRSLVPKDNYRHQNFLQGDQFQAIFLEDFLDQVSEQLGIQLMQLIVSRPKNASHYVDKIIATLDAKTDLQNREIIELVTTVMVYKFPELSREAIEAMFTVSELKKTRVYQDAQLEANQAFVIRLIKHSLGSISSEAEAKINTLDRSQIDQLGEAFLDFRDRTDLEQWLDNNS
jgi:predicted transposase YdaD